MALVTFTKEQMWVEACSHDGQLVPCTWWLAPKVFVACALVFVPDCGHDNAVVHTMVHIVAEMVS